MYSGPRPSPLAPARRRVRCALRHGVGLGLGLAAGIAFGAVPATGTGPRDVPSPDWRDQVVYFLMIDRFANGDRSNDDQGAGEADPADNAKYSGGDLRGARERIPYVRDLGATAVWITPPVANQWWNPKARYGGYHGYWATDFASVDKHFGTLEDYRAFAGSLHADGMYLIQDVVVNHVADFFHYDALPDPKDPARGLSFVRDTQGQTAPTQAPFDRNNPRDAAQRAQAIYHWTPDIIDFTDAAQRLAWQNAGLDDLNTESPEVRRALRASYGHWIREVGVDAFRVDTALYVPPAYFDDFLHADDPQAPGILRVAEATGRKDFHVFGEVFASDKPFEDAQSRRIDAWMRGPDGARYMPGMLDFPLYATATDVFARGAPPAQLGWRIEDRMRVWADPWRMATFIDNHDVDRFLASGDEAGLKQALLMLMTLPGIPVIWQGTEQGFTGMRTAMFAGGFGAQGRDHFEENAPLYQYLKRAIALRRGDKVLSRGVPEVLRSNAAGPGVLAYWMKGEGGARLVVFNTADHAALLDNLLTGLGSGDLLRNVFAIDGKGRDLDVGAYGQVSMVLPPRSGFVWRAEQRDTAFIDDTRYPSLDDLPRETFDGDFTVNGGNTTPGPVRLVVDEDLAHAVPVVRAPDGSWHARIDTSAMLDPAIEHSVVAWQEGVGASNRLPFRVARPWTSVASIDDPLGDDTGPSGKYTYPTEATYAPRQGDIEHVDVATSGGTLRLTVRMRAITTTWNPPNGFDHVAFSIFVGLPKGGGARAMPLQFADLPGDMRWNVHLRANGWGRAMFDARGATATNEGTPVTAAGVKVDPAARTITFTFPAASLGRATDLSGARIYVTTWDYDGGWRALQPAAADYAFGGGDPARDPRVLDAVGPLRIP